MIWIPEFLHYNVLNVVITDDVIDTARRLPDDSIVNELGEFCRLPSLHNNDEQLIVTAEKISQEKVEIPRFPSAGIDMPFDDDMDKGSSRWQLFLASLGIPQILLRSKSP